MRRGGGVRQPENKWIMIRLRRSAQRTTLRPEEELPAFRGGIQVRGRIQVRDERESTGANIGPVHNPITRRELRLRTRRNQYDMSHNVACQTVTRMQEKCARHEGSRVLRQGHILQAS
jgi:hypothetical protein